MQLLTLKIEQRATLYRFERENVKRPGTIITAAVRLHVGKIMAAVNLSAEKTFRTN